MRKKDRKASSLGDLVASVYEEVSSMTSNANVAARLTARAVTRWLIRSGRPDLARRLAHGAR
jgi:hypothetical protein